MTPRAQIEPHVQRAVLVLPFPLSVNALYRSVKKGKSVATILSSRGRDWKAVADAAVRNQWSGTPISVPVALDILVRAPDRRNRDIDNLLKAVLDSLEGPVLTNDSVVHDLRIRWDRSEGEACARVTVAELRDSRPCGIGNKRAAGASDLPDGSDHSNTLLGGIDG